MRDPQKSADREWGTAARVAEVAVTFIRGATVRGTAKGSHGKGPFACVTTFRPPFAAATDPCTYHNCTFPYAEMCDTYDNALAIVLLSMVGELGYAVELANSWLLAMAREPRGGGAAAARRRRAR